MARIGPMGRLARLAAALLLSLPGLPLARTSGAAGPSDASEGNDTHLSAAAELLAEAIRVPTANPPGHEAALAALWVEHLRAAGVEARVVDTPGEGRAAAWARVPGRGGARPVVLLSHLDVVSARPEEWSVDPFAGAVRDGFVWGRGALDAKGVGVVHLLALAALAARDEPLERDVILLATPDEESGGLDGAGWLARERPDLLGDAEFLLTEGGGVLLRRQAPPVWGITVVEKSPCWLRLVARGRPGHSSAPGRERDQAVPRLVAALDRVRRVETPIRVVPEVARTFAALAPTAEPRDRAGYADLARALDEDDAFRRRFLASRGRNALVRNTLAITVLEGAPRTNVLPSEASAHVDARLLPGESCEGFAAALAQVIDDPGIALETLLSFESRPSPTDTALFRAIERVAGRTDPGALVVPRAIGGFTDAHWFRELGIVSYGFVPRWLGPTDAQGVHGVDERVSVENLERGADTLVRILDEL